MLFSAADGSCIYLFQIKVHCLTNDLDKAGSSYKLAVIAVVTKVTAMARY